MKNHIFTEQIIIDTLNKWPEIHYIICNILDYIAFQIEISCEPYAKADDITSISLSELKHAVTESSDMLNIYEVQLKDLICYVNKNKDLLGDTTISKARSVQREAKLTREEFNAIVGIFNIIYGDSVSEFPYSESEKSPDKSNLN